VSWLFGMKKKAVRSVETSGITCTETDCV
jgi:hypothetical protein